MRTLQLYAIRDCIAGSFDGVFTFRNDADAQRAFCSLCSDPATNYGRFPNDFDLYFVGYFDIDSATLVPPTAPAIRDGEMVISNPVFVMHGASVPIMLQGAAVGGVKPPEDKPAEPADDTPSLPFDQVAPEQGLQDMAK